VQMRNKSRAAIQIRFCRESHTGRKYPEWNRIPRIQGSGRIVGKRETDLLPNNLEPLRVS